MPLLIGAHARFKIQLRRKCYAIMSKEKKYGLIIPAKKKGAIGSGKFSKPSAFADSSSDEEVCGTVMQAPLAFNWVWLTVLCMCVLQDSGGNKRFGSSLWKENKKRAKQIDVCIY